MQAKGNKVQPGIQDDLGDEKAWHQL